MLTTGCPRLAAVSSGSFETHRKTVPPPPVEPSKFTAQPEIFYRLARKLLVVVGAPVMWAVRWEPRRLLRDGGWR